MSRRTDPVDMVLDIIKILIIIVIGYILIKAIISAM